jgi:superfamily II DNA or RNA helicase
MKVITTKKIGKLEEFLPSKTVHVIHHDYLKKEVSLNAALDISHELFFVADEVHTCTDTGTLRTTAILQLAKLSSEIIAMTATPLNNTDTSGLSRWLDLCVNFSVNSRSFLVAANSMIVREAEILVDGIPLKKEEKEIEVAVGKEVLELLPERMGGTGKTVNFRQAYLKSQEAVTKEMVKLTAEIISENKTPPKAKAKLNNTKKVLLVAENENHAKELLRLLRDKITHKNIFAAIDGQSPPNLTFERVEKHLVEDYDVVIVPLSKNAGYNCTTLNTLITGVYPSSLAKRTQIRGRICRVGQRVNPVTMITVHGGLTTFIHSHHIEARNVEAVLAQLAAGKTAKE